MLKEGVKLVEKWKLALKEFLKRYEEDDNVIAAILCGSYALESQNDLSDINVVLILKDGVNYVTQGSTDSNSYLIEYVMWPNKFIINKMQEGFESGDFSVIHKLAYGKIIYDLDGSAKEIQDLALSYVDRPLKTITSRKLSLNNYEIWRYQDDLKDLLNENNPYFNMVYYKLLDKLLNSYYEFLELPKIACNKIYKLLTDEKTKEKYHVFKFPEKEFIKLYLKCFEEEKTSVMYKNVTNLINYYYERVGGFNVRDFMLQENIGGLYND